MRNFPISDAELIMRYQAQTKSVFEIEDPEQILIIRDNVKAAWESIEEDISEEDKIHHAINIAAKFKYYKQRPGHQISGDYNSIYRDKPSNISDRDWLELHRLRFLEDPNLYNHDMKPIYFTDNQRLEIDRQFIELCEEIRRNERVSPAPHKYLTPGQQAHILTVLKVRCEYSPIFIVWKKLQAKLRANPEKMWSLYEMERTGGAPNLVAYDKDKGEYTFFDCSLYPPAGRENLCYDRAGQEYAKREGEVRAGNAVDTAALMGIELLTVMDYLFLYDFLHGGKWYRSSEFDHDEECWLRDGYTGMVANDRVSFYKTNNSPVGLSFRGKVTV